jgi:hypothetical protein
MPIFTSAIASNLGAPFLVGLRLANSVAGEQTPVLYGGSAGTANAEIKILRTQQLCPQVGMAKAAPAPAVIYRNTRRFTSNFNMGYFYFLW